MNKFIRMEKNGKDLFLKEKHRVELIRMLSKPDKNKEEIKVPII